MKILAFAAAALSVHGAVDVLATLKRDCFGCHGDGQVLSKLDLRSREAVLKGGARGPAIVPGNADASLLLAAIEGRNGLQMPPGAKPSAEFVAAVREWINGGAVWTAWKEDYKAEDLWAFRQPKPRDGSKTVDSFLGAGKTKSDKRTLIRRVTIDLTGLPPTPKEIDEFVKDNSRDAWSRLVDRLLASPRYGERWARHWLDVVRYADTNGYSNDFERPNAWRYRDYVIRAFNQDKPYNEFILEQIAGDELFPGNSEALIATGFLRAGPWEHTGMSVEAVTRQMFLDDVTHSTAATFLGLTLGCAKCHDHKFDPLPTKDYYRMQAVFATTEFARPKLDFLQSENVTDIAYGKAHLKTIADDVKAKMEQMSPGYQQGRTQLPPDKFEEYKLYQKHNALHKESLDRYEPKAFAVSSGPRNGETDGGPNLRYPKRAEYKATDVHVLPGGNIQAPAEKVTPGVLSLLERHGGYRSPAVPETVEGRRAVLAKWIANEKNPLTARVMANRVWQYHFGKGIAADANNFGKMGAKPSNAELLDWLAGELVESGWSVKALHRAILNSEAYQAVRGEGRRIEAEVLRDSILYVSGELSPERGGPGVFPEINEDVARQPLHRMGSLSPVYRPDALKRMRNRRTIYTFQQRSLVDPMVDVFNGAGMDLSCDRRDTATVPTQAFTLFNSQFTHDMSLALGARVDQERRDTRGKISELFLRILGRAPSAAELSSTLAAFNKLLSQHKANPAAPRAAAKPVVHTITSELTGEQHKFTHPEDPASYEYNLHPSEATPEARALGDIALALINSNEFVYVY